MSRLRRDASLSGGAIMSRQSPRNMAASVRERLLTVARETHEDFNLILTRYALERLLYRIVLCLPDHCRWPRCHRVQRLSGRQARTRSPVFAWQPVPSAPPHEDASESSARTARLAGRSVGT